MKALSIISLTTAVLLAGSSLALAQDGSSVCPPAGTDAPVSEQLAAIQAAGTAQVVEIADCTGSPSTEVVDALMANESIARVLQQDTVGAGEIIAVGVQDGAVTVYVGADDEADDTSS